MQAHRSSRLLSGLSLGLVAATFLSLGACEQVRTEVIPAPAPIEELTLDPTPGQDTGIPPLSRNARGEYEQNSIDVFKKTAPSVVFVTNKQKRRDVWTSKTMEVKAGQGTGFVWDTRGHIVTNYHVVQRGSSFEVTLYGGKSYSAKLVGADKNKDLAVLKITPPKDLVPIQIPPATEKLEVGQKAIAIGNPFGFDHTLTVGVISALGREMMGVNNVTIRDMVQTDASINPGNSGGPLLDSRGRLIGVNTMISSRSGSSAGIGFAVPADAVRRSVPDIIEFGKPQRAGLGVSLIRDDIARNEGINGVIINEVNRNTPAARAGLKGVRVRGNDVYLGDVIVGINRYKVRNYDQLFNALDRYKPGDEVTVHIVRNDERKEVKLKLMTLR